MRPHWTSMRASLASFGPLPRPGWGSSRRSRETFSVSSKPVMRSMSKLPGSTTPPSKTIGDPRLSKQHPIRLSVSRNSLSMSFIWTLHVLGHQDRTAGEIPGQVLFSRRVLNMDTCGKPVYNPAAGRQGTHVIDADLLYAKVKERVKNIRTQETESKPHLYASPNG